jgi:hypothetical protein
VTDDDIDIDRIIAQAWVPREVVIAQEISDRARTALLAAGIDVIPSAEHASREPALLGVTSPFVAVQVDVDNPHDLVELLAGQLLGQAPRSHPTDARLVASR